MGYDEQVSQGKGYILHDVNGNPISGDQTLDSHMTKLCDEIDGYITEASTGRRVYPEER